MEKKPLFLMSTDWHLKRENLDEVINVVFDQIDLSKSMNLANMFVLGDIFDSRTSQRIEVLDAFLTILDYAEEQGVMVFLIPGNHDKSDYTSERSFLRAYRNHPALSLVEDNLSYYGYERLGIHMIPFFEHGSENWNKNFEAVKEKVVNGDVDSNILMLHTEFHGSVNNDGSTMSGGLKASDLEGFDTIFSGHYHDSQSPAWNIHHIPSIKQNNFGEDKNKGYTLFYNDGSFEIINSLFKKYIKIPIDIDNVSHKDILSKADEHKDDLENANIRFEIVGSEALVQSFDSAQLEDLGFTVKKKRSDLIVDEIEELTPESELFIWDNSSIIKKFEDFCTKKLLNKEKGLPLLKRIIN